MKLYELFEKDINQDIEQVIKADDTRHLGDEITEYVMTDEVQKQLDKMLDEYLHPGSVNGAWISGFFGSGKSHLLKMLSLLLADENVQGLDVIEEFAVKAQKNDNAFLAGNIRRLRDIPSRSILFNMIQIGENTDNSEDGMPVLRAFVRMFDRFCGYSEQMPHVARLERDLDKNGQYEAFKTAYKNISGREWVDGRKQAILQSKKIDEAYAAVTGDHVDGIVKQYKDTYKISALDFVTDVKNWLDAQNDPKLRINFFADEVGQFIVHSTPYMTMLQTIAETLATIIPGRSFIFVTAQEDMTAFLGNLENKAQTDDFTRIQARFGIRMKLGSKNVDEVISKRLLAKKEEHLPFLKSLYARTRSDFHMLFDFTDGSRSFPVYRDEKEFIEKYPFVPYQFDLFQSIIRAFSEQNAFEGRSSSVGERSMLGVFQKVLKSIQNTEIDNSGTLAAFYRTYDGIQDTLISGLQASLYQAEKNLGDDFTLSVLKSLFLVRFEQSFKASITNIRILMQESLGESASKLKERIAGALERLEQESYIRRSGELYEFLTDEEKAIENEIRNISVDDAMMGREMNRVVYSDIIRDNAVRYQPSGKDYKFNKYVDNVPYINTEHLTINVITPYNDDNGHTAILIGHNSGKKELMIVMKNDPVLWSELKHYLQTDKYCSVTSRTGEQSARASIISKLIDANRKRKEELRVRINTDLKEAVWITSGNIIQPQQGDPRQMVQSAMNRLIEQVYPDLKMVAGAKYNSAMISGILNRTRMLSEELQPEEKDVLSRIKLLTMGDETVTLKTLADYYSDNTYGWFEDDLQCVLSALLVKEKIELKQNGSIVQGSRSLENALTQSRNYNAVMVAAQKSYSAQQIADLRNFFQDFFTYPSTASDARALAKDTRDGLGNYYNELQGWLSDRSFAVFHPQLKDASEALLAYCGKSDEFYLTGMNDNADSLLMLKSQKLDDLRAFFNSTPQKTIYQEAQRFLRDEQDNLNSLGYPDERRQMEAILADPNCHRDGGIQKLKQLQQKLQGLIESMLITERDEAKKRIDKLESDFKAMDDYAALTEDQKQSFAREYEAARQKVGQLDRVLTIKNELRSFSDGELTRLNRQHAQAEANRTPQPSDHPIDIVYPEPPRPQPVYVSAYDLRPSGQKPILDTETDVDDYLEALRETYLTAVREGKKIRL